MSVSIKIADITGTLLDYDPSLIIISRHNFDRMDTREGLIVIDTLNTVSLSMQKTYDGENEIERISTRYVGSFQILFFGLNGYNTAVDWKNLISSEYSFELQSNQGIHIYNPSSVNNLRIEDGTNFNNLWELDFKTSFDEVTELSVLRIDTAQDEFYFNE